MAANGSEKAFCVLTFHECRSVAIVQRHFRTKFGEEPPSDSSIRKRLRSFKRQGACVKETITAEMLQTVWNELDYRIDVCGITKGAHIEHL